MGCKDCEKIQGCGKHLTELIAIYHSQSDLLAACEAQHEAIDQLFALLIWKDEKYLPSKSGQPWEAFQQGNQAIDAAKKIK